jgi:hypothetical protein
MSNTTELDQQYPGGWDYADTQTDADKLQAGGIVAMKRDGEPWPDDDHPNDCRYCAAGEPMAHNYEPPEVTVEIPLDVRDNSETVTDYAFSRHLSPGRGVVGPVGRDQENRVKRDYLSHMYDYYAWSDVNPNGQRCRFDMWVTKSGQVVNLFHTEYWTRVACDRGDWCPSYATYYTVVVDSDGEQSDAAAYCDEHVHDMRKNIADLPLTLHLSELLLIGQHD